METKATEKREDNGIYFFLLDILILGDSAPTLAALQQRIDKLEQEKYSARNRIDQLEEELFQAKSRLVMQPQPSKSPVSATERKSTLPLLVVSKLID